MKASFRGNDDKYRLLLSCPRGQASKSDHKTFVHSANNVFVHSRPAINDTVSLCQSQCLTSPGDQSPDYTTALPEGGFSRRCPVARPCHDTVAKLHVPYLAGG